MQDGIPDELINSSEGRERRVEPLGLLQDDNKSFIPITPEVCLLVPRWLVLASVPSQVLGMLSLARWAALISWRLVALLATLTASGKAGS
jgi:hypothetical protein